jgi:hypothetical protein
MADLCVLPPSEVAVHPSEQVWRKMDDDGWIRAPAGLA